MKRKHRTFHSICDRPLERDLDGEAERQRLALVLHVRTAPMDPLRLLVSSLAVWRITHLLAEEDGPWEVVVKARQGIHSAWLARVLDCFYCLSVWVAIPFATWTGSVWRERAILWPAISGAAILLERFTSRAGKEQAEQE